MNTQQKTWIIIISLVMFAEVALIVWSGYATIPQIFRMFVWSIAGALAYQCAKAKEDDVPDPNRPHLCLASPTRQCSICGQGGAGT